MKKPNSESDKSSVSSEKKTEVAASDTLLSARRYYLSKIAMACGSLSLPHSVMAQNSDEEDPLDFSFIKNPPGTLYPMGQHRLHALCMGEGDVTILFESGLGGSSLEWLPIVEKLENKVKCCMYDRAGYAWSDPGANPRHVVRLAGEAEQLLKQMDSNKHLILVGHSYGGLIMRQLASLIPDKVIGLVLVDASHETQFTRLAGESSVSMLPTSNNFVVSSPELPTGLPQDITRKIQAFSRMRKTYAALRSEIASFRDSCNYINENRTTFEFPVRIFTRGKDPYASDESAGNKNKIWNELQAEFLSLSSDSEQVVANDSGHHVHIDQPELIVDAIDKLLSNHILVK